MANVNVSTNRDLRQRFIGCFGFSFAFHIVAIVGLALAGSKIATLAEVAKGSLANYPLTIDLTTTEASLTSPAANQPSTEPTDAAAVAVAANNFDSNSEDDGDVAVTPLKPKVIETDLGKKAVLPTTLPKASPKQDNPNRDDANIDDAIKASRQAEIEVPTQNQDFGPKSDAMSDNNESQELAKPEPLQPERIFGVTADESDESKAQTQPRVGEAVSSALERGQAQSSGFGNNINGAEIRDASELRERPGNIPPTYPRVDRLHGRQGEVTFVAYVKPDGTVQNIHFERSSKSSTMDAEASRAMHGWRFMPGQAGWVRKSFNFSLSGDAEEDYARLKRQ